MKTILSLFLLFGCLFIGHVVFPYEDPCENAAQTQVEKEANSTVNLAKYTTLEDHQVARLESGEAYDFSHDSNSILYENPVLSDGVFDDVPIKGNDFYEIEPCLNCDYEFYSVEDFDKIRQKVSERMEYRATYRHQHKPSLYDDEWLEWQEPKVPLKATP